MHGPRRQTRHQPSRTGQARRGLAGAITAIATLLATLLSGVPVAAQAPSFTFADVVAQPGLTDAHARVFRLYEAFFDREPEPGGAQFWVNAFDQCWTLQHITAHFAVSDEFVATYGPAVTDEEFIDIIYANVLDRAPDAGGRAFWADQIATGAKTRAEVMLDFSWSPEFSESLPYPSDGVPNIPCNAAATDRPTPGSEGGIMAADIDSLLLPLDACPEGGTALFVEGPDATTLGDFDDDGDVDAIARLKCAFGFGERVMSLVLWRGLPAGAAGAPIPEVLTAEVYDDLVNILAVRTKANGPGSADTLWVDFTDHVGTEPDGIPLGTFYALHELDGTHLVLIGGGEETPWSSGAAVVDALVSRSRSEVSERISSSLFSTLLSDQFVPQRPGNPREAACSEVEVGVFSCFYDASNQLEPEVGVSLGLTLEFDAETRLWKITGGDYLS